MTMQIGLKVKMLQIKFIAAHQFQTFRTQTIEHMILFSYVQWFGFETSIGYRSHFSEKLKKPNLF
jgi:hypothetical protein